MLQTAWRQGSFLALRGVTLSRTTYKSSKRDVLIPHLLKFIPLVCDKDVDGIVVHQHSVEVVVAEEDGQLIGSEVLQQKQKPVSHCAVLARGLLLQDLVLLRPCAACALSAGCPAAVSQGTASPWAVLDVSHHRHLSGVTRMQCADRRQPSELWHCQHSGNAWCQAPPPSRRSDTRAMCGPKAAFSSLGHLPQAVQARGSQLPAGALHPGMHQTSDTSRVLLLLHLCSISWGGSILPCSTRRRTSSQ